MSPARELGIERARASLAHHDCTASEVPLYPDEDAWACLHESLGRGATRTERQQFLAAYMETIQEALA